MAAGPGTGGSNPFSTGTTAVQNQYPTPQSFADYLNQHWPGKRITGSGVPSGSDVGDQWLTWYAAQSAKYPSYSLGEWEQAFFTIVGAHELGDAVGQAVQATADATGQMAQGTAAGLDQFASFLSPFEDIANVFHALGETSTWLRLAKIVIGGALILAGVAHLTGAGSTAMNIAKKVPIVPV
jgi:hypothetical protein